MFLNYLFAVISLIKLSGWLRLKFQLYFAGPRSRALPRPGCCSVQRHGSQLRGLREILVSLLRAGLLTAALPRLLLRVLAVGPREPGDAVAEEPQKGGHGRQPRNIKASCYCGN